MILQIYSNFDVADFNHRSQSTTRNGKVVVLLDVRRQNRKYQWLRYKEPLAEATVY